MVQQTNNPATTSTDSEQSLYQKLAKEELDLIKSIEGKIDKLPDIPVVKAFFLWKIKEYKTLAALSTGINPQTGRPFEKSSERVKVSAETFVDALKSGLESTADAVLAGSGGRPSKFTDALKIFGRRGGESQLLENAPQFFRLVAGKIQDPAVKNALVGFSGVLEEIINKPEAKEAMVNALKNWKVWQKFTTEAQDEILQERILREADQKFDTIESLSPAPNNILITLQPTLRETEKKVKKARSKVQIRIKELSSAGQITLSSADKIGLRDARFPIGEFQDSEISAAVNLYSKGARSKNLEAIIDKLSALSRKDQSHLYRIAFVVAALEETYGKESQDIFTAQGGPQVLIQPSLGPTPSPQANQLLLQRDQSGILRPFLETGLDIAKDKAKNLVMNALKKGGTKLIEKGATIAAKAGISKAATAVVGTIAGGPVGLIATALLFARDLLKKFSSWLQRGIRKLLGLGEPDPNKRNAIIFAALAGAFLFTGFLPGVIVAGGIALGYAAASAGGVSGIATAFDALIYGVTAEVIPSIAFSALLAVVAIPLITVFILFIINTSAYLVPPGGFLSGPPGSIQNPYIHVEKVANPEKTDNPPPNRLISYTITVTAKKDSLTNIKFNYTCSVAGQGSGTNCPKPQSNIPSPPTIITPTNPFVINYQVSYDSSFSNSIITDTFTVTADALSATNQTAAASESVVIGNPPIDCPIPNGIISWASYIPGDETSKRHGNNAYWAGGTPCRWSLPQSIGCYGPTDPKASGNICFNQSSKCPQYGYAIDVIGSTEVLAPQVAGNPVTWNCSYAFANPSSGHSYRCTSGQYTLILTHMATSSYAGTYTSGDKIGELFPWGYNTHLHIEFAINGVYQRPEDYFCR